MESALAQLIESLQASLRAFKGPLNEQLIGVLHNHDKLPEKALGNLALQAVDLLHETEQFLEPGTLVLADHFLGYINTKCLCTAIELKIPDVLKAKGPLSLENLATATNARSDRLRQVLRILYNNGIFTYDKATDTYSNNHTSKLLLSDHWTQWHNWVDLYGNEFYDMARGIPASVRKDAVRTPAQINYDTDIDMFTYFSDQGWLPRLHATLGGGAVAQAPGILEDYPWEEIGNSELLDIGGGGGGLISLLLRKHEQMRAGILDLPKVIEHARQNFHKTGGQYADVGDRVEKSSLIVGDFLVAVPAFEVYTMKWCLHNWKDDAARKILANVRKAIIQGPRSRFVILESLLTDGRSGRLSRYGDITMLVSADGLERSEEQWRALAVGTGWTIRKIYRLRNSWPCAIELVPVWDLG